MTGDKARFDRARDELLFNGNVRSTDDSSVFVLHPSDLATLTVIQVQEVIRQAQRHRWGDDQTQNLAFADTTSLSFDEDYSARKPYHLELAKRSGHIELLFSNSKYEDELTEAEIRNVLRPLLEQHRLEFVAASPHLSGPPDPPWLWVLQLSLEISNRDFGGLLRALDQVDMLLVAFESGTLDRGSARVLIAGGNVLSLIGQHESDWLEAKTTVYDLDQLAGKISLALSVARFANSASGGLVVFGLRTKRTVAGEVIVKVSPLPVDPKLARRVRHVLQHHLFPPVEGLDVITVGFEQGQLLIIDVPPQPLELLPFLVHGAIVGGRGEGSFFSIVRRAGDESIATTAPMIHSTIAAGRALLRPPTLG